MAFQFDETHVYAGQHMVCKEGIIPPSLGIGPLRIKGSSYVQGPFLTGSFAAFPYPPVATAMVAPRGDDGPVGIIPGAICGRQYNPYSLAVLGPTALLGSTSVNGNVDAIGNITAVGEVISRCGAHILSAKKNFDIPHPTREGWRLRHTCPEGPSNDVYFRGRLTNKKIIFLPQYWEELVDPTTITVNLTPIGAHQNIIVKRIADNQIHLQANGGMPIDCYYHVFGTRADGERLIPEYEGSSPADYPGDNSQYSISGYHYDVKEG